MERNMNYKIQWFNNVGANEGNIEYLALRDNTIICRVRREEEFGNLWVARNINGDCLEMDQYRYDLFDWIENKFG